MSKLSYHVSVFSEKVRTMNQTGSKNLILSSEEARNLHTDIFSLLAKITELSDTTDAPDTSSVELDGGKF